MIPLSDVCQRELDRLGVKIGDRSGEYKTVSGPLGRLCKAGQQLDVRGLTVSVNGATYPVTAALERCLVVECADGSRRLVRATDAYVDESAVRWLAVPKVRGGVRDRWLTA